MRFEVIDRETGERAEVIDVSGRTDTEAERIFDGLVRKVDFRRYLIARVVPRPNG